MFLRPFQFLLLCILRICLLISSPMSTPTILYLERSTLRASEVCLVLDVCFLFLYTNCTCQMYQDRWRTQKTIKSSVPERSLPYCAYFWRKTRFTVPCNLYIPSQISTNIISKTTMDYSFQMYEDPTSHLSSQKAGKRKVQATAAAKGVKKGESTPGTPIFLRFVSLKCNERVRSC
jgi:hypothetical protein